MKVSAKVLQTKIMPDGGMLAKIRLNGKLPPKGTIISCKWGKTRSNKQNSIYWLILTWYIENGMQDMGYMTKDELHEAMKSKFLTENYTDPNGITYSRTKSTTELTVDEFMAYIEKIEHCILEYCQISSVGFWQEHADNFGE